MPVNPHDGPGIGFGLAPGQGLFYNASLTLLPVVAVVSAVVVIALMVAWFLRDREFARRPSSRTVAM